MRIYNGTNSLVTLPITGTQQITINPKSVSIDFMGGTDFISMLVTSFDPKEVALVVSGPYELSVCATVPTAVNYVVQTLDEAIQRFAIPKNEEVKAESTPKAEEEPVVEEIVHEKDDMISLPSDVTPEETVGETKTDEIESEETVKPKPKKTRRPKKTAEEGAEGDSEEGK